MIKEFMVFMYYSDHFNRLKKDKFINYPEPNHETHPTVKT